MSDDLIELGVYLLSTWLSGYAFGLAIYSLRRFGDYF